MMAERPMVAASSTVESLSLRTSVWMLGRVRMMAGMRWASGSCGRPLLGVICMAVTVRQRLTLKWVGAVMALR